MAALGNRLHLFSRQRADIDHPGGIVLAGGLAQLWQQLTHQGKGPLDVDRHHRRPGLVGKGIQGGTPGAPGVVDQDIQLVLLLLETVRQRHHRLGGIQAGGDGHALTEGAELLRTLFADIRLPGGDIDLGAGLNQPLGDHPSHALGTTGYQGHLAFDVEKFTHGLSSF